MPFHPDWKLFRELCSVSANRLAISHQPRARVGDGEHTENRSHFTMSPSSHKVGKDIWEVLQATSTSKSRAVCDPAELPRPRLAVLADGGRGLERPGRQYYG